MHLLRYCAIPLAILLCGGIAVIAPGEGPSSAPPPDDLSKTPRRPRLETSRAAHSSAVPLTVTGLRDFQVDVDLNHDGVFDHPGERGYAVGRYGQARLHGLIDGRYRVRARGNVSGREHLSDVRVIDVAPPAGHAIPVSFEPNQGQAHADVAFLARAQNQVVFIGKNETTLVEAKTQRVSRFRLVGASPAAVPGGGKKLPGSSNYFIGNQSKRWHTDVPQYEEVITPGVYPGIDLVHHSSRGQLEYDFHVAPGADPGLILLEFPDIRSLRIDEEGGLVLTRSDGTELRKSAPLMYQFRGQRREAIKGDWCQKGNNCVGYTIAGYDRTRELVIDPIVYSTYLGGTLDETAQAAFVDAAGNTYVTGFTLSANFPVQSPFQATRSGTQDLFVCKINPAGTAIVYATYLGGTDADGWVNGKQGIVVDSAGNAIITAGTPSNDYPMLNAAQATFGGLPWDCVVTKLNPAGNALVFSTYLGGNSWDLGYGVTVDATNNIYVTGLTSSPNFPTTAGAFQTTPGGGNDAFVAKYTPAGVVSYSTFLGGSGGNEWGRAIAVRGTNAYVVGVTDSPNFPTSTGALQTTNGGSWDVFVTQLNAAGAGLVYSTYLGGSQIEDSWGVVVDATGNAFVACRTDSANFPTTPGAAQTTFGGGTTDGAIIKLNPTGTALVYSTYLGGSAVDELRAIAVDGAGVAYVTGFTLSANFPAVAPLQPAFGGGGGDAFVSVLNATGSAFTLSTWLGGSGPEGGVGIGLDGAGNIYVAGSTTSTNFPTLTPIQAANAGSSDIFVTKINLTAPPRPPSSQVLYGITGGDQLIIINTSTGAGSLVGNVSPPMNSTGIAFRGSQLYGVDNTTTRIRELNPANAATLASINIGSPFGGSGDLTFRNDGVGFLSDTATGGRLYRVDITAPSSSLISGTFTPNMIGLGFDPSGTLLGFSQGGAGLYTIDQATGATTLVGNTGLPNLAVGGMAVDAAGNVYASHGPIAGNSLLYSINRTTGVATLIGSIGFNSVTGLAFQPVSGGGGGGGGGGNGGGPGEGSYPGSTGPAGVGGHSEGSYGFGGGGFAFGGGILAARSPVLRGPDALGGSEYCVANVSGRLSQSALEDTDSQSTSALILCGLGLAVITVSMAISRLPARSNAG